MFLVLKNGQDKRVIEMKNVGNMLMSALMKAIPIAIIAAILITVLGIALAAVETFFVGIGTVVATFVMGIITFLLFVYAKEMHKGKEGLVDMLPVMILVITIGSVFANWIPALLVVLEIHSVMAIAMSLVVVYLASALSKKYIKL